ncbi:phospholipid-binding lipoprotein MlaA [Alteromonadaceae bacterium Bs31]|nr:phospholipid-binding lipoprotein MlaA [Alteromonadaceae bacterium Bs31]
MRMFVKQKSKLLPLLLVLSLQVGCASNAEKEPDLDSELSSDTAAAEPLVHENTAEDAFGDTSFEEQQSFDADFDEAGFDDSSFEEAASSTGSTDSLESFNRAMFSFNMTLDRWFFRPLAVGYTKIAPQPVETGVDNFFSNLREIPKVLNDVLQWKWKQAGHDTGRFLLNSTVGVVGLFDVAKHAGLPESDSEDFGQTLAVWGVPQGPYIVVPFLGPYTLASGVAAPVDWVSHPLWYVDSKTVAYSAVALEMVHLRSELLASEELMSGDLYIFIRDAYLQRREFLINDGIVEDDFGDVGEDEEFDF